MPEETSDDTPSKSARKRTALAAQDLGARLIGLRDAELLALDLPEALLEAILEARRLTSRAALARQRQFIGKLMRRIDTAGIEAALARQARAGERRPTANCKAHRTLARTRMSRGGRARCARSQPSAGRPRSSPPWRAPRAMAPAPPPYHGVRRLSRAARLMSGLAGR